MGTWMADGVLALYVLEVGEPAVLRRADGRHDEPTTARDADNGATASSNAPLQTTAVTSACSRMDRISGGDSRLFRGTDTAPILWTAL